MSGAKTMRILLTTALALTLASACGGEEPPSGPASTVTIQVAPLSLTGVADAEWTVTVYGGVGGSAPMVWTKTLRSSAYGNGEGDVSYVGPCDASVGASDVSVHLDGLYDGGDNPLPYDDPGTLTRTVTCLPDADVPVDFDVSVARPAQQGFFDVAVELDDVFCSAKLDCKRNGQPIELLFDEDGDRGPTVVVAFACTSGANTPTYLHMTELSFDCDDGTHVAHVPSAGPGNVGGGDGDFVFQRAVYRAEEQLAPYTKCAWSHAFGLDLDALSTAGVSCTLSGRATASSSAWDQGFSPEGAFYPYIDWNVPIITAGAFSCDQHQIDVTDSGVATEYTNGTDREYFGYTMSCEEDTPVAVNGFSCGGTIPGFDEEAVIAPSGGGVVVTIGSSVSAPLPLPTGVNAQLDGCCLDPCCVE